MAFAFSASRARRLKTNTFSAMPKHTSPIALMGEFGGSRVWIYNPDTKDLFCKLCSTPCPANRRSTVSQHVESMKHKNKLEDQQAGVGTSQVTLHQVVTSAQAPAKFAKDLTKMLVACNIPLFKVENPILKDFMKTYCRETIPTRFTLTRNMEKESIHPGHHQGEAGRQGPLRRC